MGDTKKTCASCKRNITISSNFYKSYSKFDADNHMQICRKCLRESIDYNNIQTVKDTLTQINRPYIHSIWISSSEEAKNKNQDHFGLYIKTIQMKDFRDLTWKDSDDVEATKKASSSPTPSKEKESVNDELKIEQIESELQDNNRLDVIKMLGYDPFEFENDRDRRHLYNKLVDFLDEGTLEDGFKLPTVIEIVKTFNQLDKINNTISNMTTDVQSLTTNAGTIKSLIDAKDKLYKSVLALAKDNGISVNHNNNKSKGSGTLSGIIKQLQEKGFEESSVNLFDIETCAGMSQVADISNESIFKQLQFDENDYSAMLIEQREIIGDLSGKVTKYEEEIRVLKKELLKLTEKNI
ncbi:hypothetical protein DFQ00_102424 [Paenibacillus barcinonensis]|uniref:Uncharacterized protein n=2 Tax=Paenibacillus barcinonensis TaxID=198119 RepID=A0A2V4WTE7_PAEBA|nr:hypothetical protein [Paenibacillus barcinonensis]PYE51629.1 hypothetical protein DFQ00_102424 [Paenibacillus barcinonensis]